MYPFRWVISWGDAPPGSALCGPWSRQSHDHGPHSIGPPVPAPAGTGVSERLPLNYTFNIIPAGIDIIGGLGGGGSTFLQHDDETIASQAIP